MLQYKKYKGVLSLCGFLLDSANTNLGLHVPLGIFERKNLGCYPSIVNRVDHLVNCDTPNTTFGEIAFPYFLVRQEVFCSSQFLGKPFFLALPFYFVYLFLVKINQSSWKYKIFSLVVHIDITLPKLVPSVPMVHHHHHTY